MFSVSSRTRYAIRAMARLATCKERCATSSEISELENIPSKYLEGIMARLKMSGLIESVRGKNGGYKMTKQPKEIKMRQIVEAMDGSVKPVLCVDTPSVCNNGKNCHPRKFWIGLKETIDAYLDEKTLEDMLEE